MLPADANQEPTMPDTPQPAPALKEIFNLARIEHIAEQMAAVLPGFDQQRFITLASEGLEQRSIMQRMAHIADCLHAVMGLEFAPAIEVLTALAPRLNSSFVTLSLPHYVATHGQPHFELAMQALAHFTTFGSAEFAIRAFLLADFERTLAVMEGWALSDNEHVRRLASEGSRPRLPWAARLPQVQHNPERVARLLGSLRADPSLYVRKSVANHLNDITKDHPEWVLDTLHSWQSENPHTRWITRHALRSLIKQGHPRALAMIGASGAPQLQVENFSITPAQLRLGESMQLGCTLVSSADSAQQLVVDYAIDFVKSNGQASAKVFKLKNLALPAGGRANIQRTQHIRALTTRKHYLGVHRVHLLVNGERVASGQFELIE
jgi:3-methyladenine DNA glycosylase AlkC